MMVLRNSNDIIEYNRKRSRLLVKSLDMEYDNSSIEQ